MTQIKYCKNIIFFQNYSIYILTYYEINFPQITKFDRKNECGSYVSMQNEFYTLNKKLNSMQFNYIYAKFINV